MHHFFLGKMPLSGASLEALTERHSALSDMCPYVAVTNFRDQDGRSIDSPLKLNQLSELQRKSAGSAS